MIFETELAWAAGLFDGEGCTSASWTPCRNHTKGHRQFKLTVSQGHLEVLNRFKAAVGVGTINGPHPASKSGNPMWRYSAGVTDAGTVMRLLWPYLSSVKRQQYTDKVEWYNTPRG